MLAGGTGAGRAGKSRREGESSDRGERLRVLKMIARAAAAGGEATERGGHARRRHAAQEGRATRKARDENANDRDRWVTASAVVLQTRPAVPVQCPHGPPRMAQPSTRPPNRCPTSPSSPQMNSNHPTRSPAARPRYRLPNLHPSTGWAAPRHLLFSFLSSFPSLAFPNISMPRTPSVGWGAGAVLG